MSATHAHEQTLPRGLLLAMGALVLTSLVAVGAVRWSGLSIHEPDAGVAVSRSLRFADTADGSVSVIDAVTGLEVDRVAGEAGFLRGALRALARERRMRQVGPEAAFELVARADGRLTLLDPATGSRIDLESFGPTNAATFARLLTVNRSAAPAGAPK